VRHRVDSPESLLEKNTLGSLFWETKAGVLLAFEHIYFDPLGGCVNSESQTTKAPPVMPLADGQE